jgi:hypothetical protein
MGTKTVLDRTSGQVLSRTLAEGYGPGAWHGADFKAAIADVTEETAFRRPAKGRHSIAEIALHHAYCTRAVRGRLAGTPPEPFVLEGDDWFDLAEPSPALAWKQIVKTVDAEQRRLAEVVERIATGGTSPLSESERFDVVLGITCHAVYHAGQVQLIKKLL